MLAGLGDRVDKGRIPFLHAPPPCRRRAAGLGRDPDRVLRRPVCRPALAAACSSRWRIPAFAMHTVQTGTDDLPRKLEVMRVYDRMQAAFPGGQIPATVAVQASDVTTPQIRPRSATSSARPSRRAR